MDQIKPKGLLTGPFTACKELNTAFHLIVKVPMIRSPLVPTAKRCKLRSSHWPIYHTFTSSDLRCRLLTQGQETKASTVRNGGSRSSLALC
ncbi:hypothetical protein J6590_076703 [Homalodisca vitripennis]|nr:hypothetical protein J6590_076703 [Homalodisca vitripennis]